MHGVGRKGAVLEYWAVSGGKIRAGEGRFLSSFPSCMHPRLPHSATVLTILDGVYLEVRMVHHWVTLQSC